MAEKTDPLAKGLATSEGKIAAILIPVAAVFGSLAPFIDNLRQAFPGAPWLSIAAMVVGWGVALFTALGYLKSRAYVKAAAITTDTPPLGGAAQGSTGSNP